jgi:valyl-tRNA synthetase
VQSLFHTGKIPWYAVMISGHAQDPSGNKLSKSKLKAAEDPTATIEQFSADAVRYWTAGVRTGSDTIVSDEVFKQGNRLVTKLWNAARFALMHSTDGGDVTADLQTADLTPSDLWLLDRLAKTVARTTSAFNSYEVSLARGHVERFFWADLCDTYLELAKYRLMQPTDEAARAAAIQTLRAALLAVLKMLAPFLPHVTDEIYLRAFAAEDGAASVHVSAWPDASAYPSDERSEQLGETLLAVIESVRRWKSDRNLSVGAAIGALSITCRDDQLAALRDIEQDLRSITRADRIVLNAGESVGVHVEEATQPR